MVAMKGGWRRDLHHLVEGVIPTISAWRERGKSAAQSAATEEGG